MDPFATLAAWTNETDADTRAELAEAYNAWRSHGGYAATLPDSTLIVERMHRHTLTVTR